MPAVLFFLHIQSLTIKLLKGGNEMKPFGAAEWNFVADRETQNILVSFTDKEFFVSHE